MTNLPTVQRRAVESPMAFLERLFQELPARSRLPPAAPPVAPPVVPPASQELEKRMLNSRQQPIKARKTRQPVRTKLPKELEQCKKLGKIRAGLGIKRLVAKKHTVVEDQTSL
eukprot:gene18449-24928_t